jgi:NADH:ubiquinone oxidoreductase subunit F (NADH-binding)
MPLLNRVLDGRPCLDLDAYVARGGGRGLAVARRLGSLGVVDEVEASGLRGRGGAGFSAGRKWRSIALNRSAVAPTSVVVNGAEGEPGTFKDRALLRCNPYKAIEGALIAAVAVEASELVVCLKASFGREVRYVTDAIAEMQRAGWMEDVRVRVVQGPSSYLYGEETALLEVVEGRQPFPRVDPPFRRGLDPRHADVGHSAAQVHLAGPGGTDAPPALVNNVETMANVPGILRHGADWYRSVGTAGSPGTVVCTITGHTRRHGVGEVAMGTTLREAIDLIGGGPRTGHRIMGVLSGVANPIIPSALLDTPLCFDEMAQVGTGLGAGGFIVFQDGTDLLDVAHGAARFLAVESCGQCSPCKSDGLAIADHLEAATAGTATARDFQDLDARLATVTRGARCSLASQQERVVTSILDLFDEGALQAVPVDGSTPPVPIVPLVDIVDGRAILDSAELLKQPDWTYGPRDSGSWPAARLGNTPVELGGPRVGQDLHAGRMSAVVTAPLQSAPFPGLITAHEGLQELLDDIVRTEPERRPPLVRSLADRLRLHLDVTGRVLYPMVRRVAAADGDDASWAAEEPERAGLRLLTLLARSAANGAASERSMLEFREALRSHIEAEQARVVPLLQEHLDAGQLDALADALAEARLTSTLRAPRQSRVASTPEREGSS